MLISTILEAFTYFKRNEDGSIDKSSVKFEINNRLYRAININELQELIEGNTWRMNQDNTSYAYSYKYPYYKSMFRISEQKVLRSYIKKQERIIVEFDKNELLKIRNIKIKPVSFWSSPKFKATYDLFKHYNFSIKKIKKDEDDIIPEEYKNLIIELIHFLKNNKITLTRPGKETEFEERILSKKEFINLPQDKSKIIKRIWVSKKYFNVFPRKLKNKIFESGIKMYKLNYVNENDAKTLQLKAHNQLYTPENQRSLMDKNHEIQQVQKIKLNGNFNNLIKEYNDSILPIISKENRTKKENACINIFIENFIKRLKNNYYKIWKKINLMTKKDIQNNKNLIEKYNKAVSENNFFIKEYKDIINQLYSINPFCKEKINFYNNEIEKHNNYFKNNKINVIELEKIVV